MTSIDQIKAAIHQLPDKDRIALRDWLLHLNDDDWDRQMADDAAAGRLNILDREINDAIRNDTLRESP